MSKISRKFNLLLILSVALSVFLSSLSITVYLLIRYEQNILERDRIQLDGISENIRAFLEHAITINYQLSISPEIRDSILEADSDWDIRSSLYSSEYETSSSSGLRSGHPLLTELQSRYNFTELFFVQDKNGDQTARSLGALGRRADRWWYKNIALEQDYRPFLSHSYYSLTGGIPVASIFHPIMDKGQFIGIMGMDINFAKLQEIVESFMVLDDMYAIVTDMEGVIIAYPDPAVISEIYNLKDMTRSVLKEEAGNLNEDGYLDMERSSLDWPEKLQEAVVRATSGETGDFEKVHFESGSANVFYAPVTLGNSVISESSYAVLLVQDREAIVRARNSIIIIIIIFITAVILVLYYIFHARFRKNILSPLEVLIDSMKSLELEQFEEIHFDRDDEFDLLSHSYNNLRRKLVEANDELKYRVSNLKESEEGYKSFAEIGLALSTEKNIDRLMEMILDESRKLTRADGGTLYLYNEKEECLEFSIMHNDTMNSRMGGTSGIPVTLPPVPLTRDGEPNKGNVSSCAAITGKVININDVYKAEDFDFSGTRTYDRLNNYNSRSMLVIPMKNMAGKLIGVIQLINARKYDYSGVQAFSDANEKLIVSLASQAAVALTNVQLAKDLEELFHAFIRSIAAAIDAKSAFTGGHIKRVVKLTSIIARGVNADESGPYRDRVFSDDEMEELNMAAWMHDIGKVTTPENVMDKKTKLEGMFDGIDLIESRYRMLCGLSDRDKGVCDHDSLKEEMDFLKSCNISGEYLSDDKYERLEKIREKTYTLNGVEYPYLTEDEFLNLSIRKGNLNTGERKLIENHAEMTRRILGELTFPDHLSMVGEYACMHHEKLDGSGYPRGLKGDEIPLQARIISVADIFEALTAKDRPYREPMKLSKALQIMEFMVKDGHIDGDVFLSFRNSGGMRLYVREELNPGQADIELPESGHFS